MKTDYTRDQIGRGIGFPITFEGGAMVWDLPEAPTEEQFRTAIQRGCRFILGTSVGSGFMMRRFGSNAADLLFEANNGAAVDMLMTASKQALATYFPTLIIDSLSGYQNGTGIVLEIRYHLQHSGRQRTTEVAL